MAGALEWTLALKDKLSGPGAAMGGVLTSIATKLRTATAATDAFQKKQESAFRVQPRTIGTSIGPRGATATDATRSADPLGDLGANMRKHDAEAFAAVEKKAAAATRAVEAYNKAISKSSEGTLGKGRETMGKTGANGAGLFGKAPDLSWTSKLQQAMGGLFGSKGADAVASLTGGLDKLGGLAAGPLGAVASVIGNIIAMVAKLGLAVAGLAVAGALAGAKYVASMQAFKQSTMFAFSALLGGQSKADEGWKRMQAAAVKTGTPLEDTAKSFNTLLARGFKLDQADTIFKQMADLKSMNPATNIDAITNAIAQVKSKGKLTQEELTGQLGEQINTDLVYDELSKKLGKDKATIMKMISAGSIDSTTGIDAIQAAIKKQSGGGPAGAMAEKMANTTILGGLGRLQARVESFASGLKVDFVPIAGLLDRLGKGLEGESGKAFGAAIEQALNSFIKLADKVTTADIAAAFGAATWSVEALVWAAEKVGVAIDWAGKIGSALSTLNEFTGITNVIAYGFELILNPVNALGNLIDGIWGRIVNLSSSLLGIKLPTFDSMLNDALGMGDTAKKTEEKIGTSSSTSTVRPSAPPADRLGDAIRKATEPPAQATTPGAPGRPAGAPGAAEAKPGAPPPRGPTSITVSANGLTFEGFEAKVAEIVRAEMDKG